MLKKLLQKLKTSDYLVIISLACFLIYKLSNLAFRFSDGNAYLYMLQSMLHGILPYRDFFLADPPGFLLFLVSLKPFLGQHWLWYQGMPACLEIMNALVIYLLLRPKIRMSWLVVPIYLFSFTVLSTSNFGTGVQLTVLFSLLAWLFWEKNYPVLSGVGWALACLTKLYAAPAFIGFLGYIIYKKYAWRRFFIAFVSTGLIVIVPFFLASPHGFIQSIIVHQLNRTAGNNKLDIWIYFFQHEWPLILLGAAGACLKSARIYLVPFIMSIVFFLLFRDLYYLYLDYFFAYLVIFSVVLLQKLWGDLEVRPFAVIASLILAWSVLGGGLNFQSSAEAHSEFSNANEIANYLTTQNTYSEIYGSHEIAPILSLMSGKKLFGNYIDTNAQVFSARTYDIEKISKASSESGVYLVARVTDLPEYGIKDAGYEGYFSKDVFARACTRLKFFPSDTGTPGSFIGIYNCKL